MSVHLIYGNGLSTLQRGPRASESPEMWCQQLEHTLSAGMWSMDSLGVRGKWELSHEGMLFSHSSVPGIWSRCYMNRPNVLWELLTIGTFQTFPYFFCILGCSSGFKPIFHPKMKMLSSWTHPRVSEHKWRCFAECPSCSFPYSWWFILPNSKGLKHSRNYNLIWIFDMQTLKASKIVYMVKTLLKKHVPCYPLHAFCCLINILYFLASEVLSEKKLNVPFWWWYKFVCV